MALSLNTLHSKLHFDIYSGLIFLVLCGTYKILRAIFLIFCSNFFSLLGVMENQYFPIVLANKWFSFEYLDIYVFKYYIIFGLFPILLWFNLAVKAYWKQLSSSFSGFIVAPFFNHFGESIYDPALLRLILWRYH